MVARFQDSTENARNTVQEEGNEASAAEVHVIFVVLFDCKMIPIHAILLKNVNNFSHCFRLHCFELFLN